MNRKIMNYIIIFYIVNIICKRGGVADVYDPRKSQTCREVYKGDVK